MYKNVRKEGPKPDIRELTIAHGISYPSDEELLMLILNKGTRNAPVEVIAQKALNALNASNQENLMENLLKINGIGKTKALTIAASMELGRRRNGYQKSVINKPKDILPFVMHYALESTEHFVCASVNGAHELLKIRLISKGTINKTLIHPREIFSSPVAEHAAGIICCHNHPYGPCTPSKADIESTRLIQKASEILGISFMDHIIIGREEYFSFLEHGLLEP